MKFKIENGMLISFSDKDKSKKVIVPDGVVNIGERAFVDFYPHIEVVVLPEGVKRIRKEAFENCSTLENIVLPDSLQRICENAFHNCTSLKKMVLPKNITSLDSFAFANCSSLECVVIPKNMKVLSESAFFYCPMYMKIILQGDKTKIIIQNIDLYVYYFYDFVNGDIKEKEELIKKIDSDYYRTAYATYLFFEYESKKAEKYVRENIVDAINYLTDNNEPENVAELVSYIRTEDEINSVIKYAIDNKRAEIEIILMNYKREKFGFKNGLDELML